MPRKHKNEGNVVPFQTTRNPAQPDAAQAQQEGIPVVIKKIDENRASGMKNLEKKLSEASAFLNGLKNGEPLVVAADEKNDF